MSNGFVSVKVKRLSIGTCFDLNNTHPKTKQEIAVLFFLNICNHVCVCVMDSEAI